MEILDKAWKEWEENYSSPLFLDHRFFGRHFINNYTVRKYTNPEIFNETDNEKAYTELLWTIASGELDGKLVDSTQESEYTPKTNQEGGA